MPTASTHKGAISLAPLPLLCAKDQKAEEASQQPVQAPASTSVQRQIHPHRTTRRDKSTEQQPRRVRRSTQKIKYLQSTYPLIIPQKMLVSRRCHPAGHALSKLQSSPEAMHKHPIRMKKLKSPPNSAALSRRRKVCGRRRRSHPSKKKKRQPPCSLSLSQEAKRRSSNAACQFFSTP